MFFTSLCYRERVGTNIGVESAQKRFFHCVYVLVVEKREKKNLYQIFSKYSTKIRNKIAFFAYIVVAMATSLSQYLFMACVLSKYV